MFHQREPRPVTQSAPEAVITDTPVSGEKAPVTLADRLYAHAEANGSLSVIDKLRYLHEKGETAKLDDYIDDVVYRALEGNEDFIANMRELKELRSSNSSNNILENEIRLKQNQIFNEYRRNLISLSGLPSEIGHDESEVAQQKAKHLIETHFQNGGEKGDVLETLGILTRDEDGKEIFTFPHELLPEETNKKWDLYLDRVREHLRTMRGVEAGTRVAEELVMADTLRKHAHDAVTRDVHTILGLDKLVDDSWDFSKTRNLIAKMRDSRYPTVATSEKDVTAIGVLKAAEALGILSTKLSNLK